MYGRRKQKPTLTRRQILEARAKAAEKRRFLAQARYERARTEEQAAKQELHAFNIFDRSTGQLLARQAGSDHGI